TNTGDVSGNLDAAGKAHTGYLAQGRVRHLWGGRVDAGAHTAALRTSLKRRGFACSPSSLAALTDQLLHGGHYVSVSARLYKTYVELTAVNSGLLPDFRGRHPTPAPGRVACMMRHNPP